MLFLIEIAIGGPTTAPVHKSRRELVHIVPGILEPITCSKSGEFLDEAIFFLFKK